MLIGIIGMAELTTSEHRTLCLCYWSDAFVRPHTSFGSNIVWVISNMEMLPPPEQRRVLIAADVEVSHKLWQQ